VISDLKKQLDSNQKIVEEKTLLSDSLQRDLEQVKGELLNKQDELGRIKEKHEELKADNIVTGMSVEKLQESLNNIEQEHTEMELDVANQDVKTKKLEVEDDLDDL